MPITKKTMAAIRKHAESDYPNEACGVIVKVGKSEVYIPCENIAKDKTQDFKISPIDYAMAEEEGEIVGIFHSHPDGTAVPSKYDRACMSVNAELQRKYAPDSEPVLWHIVSWPEDNYIEVDPEIHESILGRPFIHGLWDCWQTCNDYYDKYHKLQFPRYEREDGWWEDKDAVSLYETHWPKTPFEDVTGDDLQVGALIIMQIGRTYHPNHAAVYLGKISEFEGQPIGGPGPFILHHVYGRPSCIEVYGGQWQQRTRFVLRHKEIKNGG